MAEDRERHRLATGLHDGLSQTLTLARMKVGAMRQSTAAADLEAPLQQISGLIDDALDSSGTLTF